jgi:glycosyltransferase involved in cell wall biosynthesis
LLDAIVEMKKVNSSFVLAAVHTGKPEFDFQTELSKRGISEFFRDFGEIPPRELNKIYNMADIFCLPSHSEGMANVVVEAMASGLPVLTTSVGGHAELVNNGATGILIPSQQPGSIAEQLLALLDNARLRTGLGTAAREFILKDWGNSKESTVLLYKKLCSA